MLIADICIVGLDAAAVRYVDTLRYSSQKYIGFYRIVIPIQGDTSSRQKPPVDLDLVCSAFLPGQ